MLRKQITDNYSVSDQISLANIETLSQLGITLIICNRPDNEEEGQLSFAEVEALAKEKTLTPCTFPLPVGKCNLRMWKRLKPSLREATTFTRIVEQATALALFGKQPLKLHQQHLLMI